MSISYSCSGISPTEDIDSAKVENVITTSSNLTAEKETVDISPNSIGGEAIKFTKSNNSSSNMILGFGEEYVIEDVAFKKVEFDMKTSNINYGKTLQLVHDTSTVGTTIDSNKHTSYKITSLEDEWYHVEVPITALSPTISGYKVDGKWQDVNTKISSKINGVKINAGNCIIDNFRLGSTSSDLGLFNNGSSFNVSDAKPYWLKVSWTGQFHSCVLTFDNSIAEQVLWDNVICRSPFYVRGLSTGTVTVTATLTVGYNRQIHTIQSILTIN